MPPGRGGRGVRQQQLQFDFPQTTQDAGPSRSVKSAIEPIDLDARFAATIAERRRRQEERARVRAEFAEARRYGLAARHATKLTRLRNDRLIAELDAIAAPVPPSADVRAPSPPTSAATPASATPAALRTAPVTDQCPVPLRHDEHAAAPGSVTRPGRITRREPVPLTDVERGPRCGSETERDAAAEDDVAGRAEAPQEPAAEARPAPRTQGRPASSKGTAKTRRDRGRQPWLRGPGVRRSGRRGSGWPNWRDGVRDLSVLVGGDSRGPPGAALAEEVMAGAGGRVREGAGVAA